MRVLPGSIIRNSTALRPALVGLALIAPSLALADAQGQGVAVPPRSAPAAVAAPLAPAAPPPPYCSGEYADDYAALSAKARDFERQLPSYTFCIRTTATYECPWYGSDGTLRKTKKRAVAHGTGFAYRQQGGDTLLLTNEHVAEWPAVTDEEHPVEEVPAGCKRVSDALTIVDAEDDAYEHDDIPLARVVTDPQLDIAVLKAKGALPVMPWKVGRSAGLRERNVVDVRGFPLGVFKATNVGKVVSAYDHDDDHDWDHDDFVVDALLSPGNSGSPVFAISCKTGEFELAGVYHARYSGGSALNVVIGIDQLRDVMTTLKRTPRPHSDGSVVLDADTRSRILTAGKTGMDPFFPFGALTARIRARGDGAILYELLNREFPTRVYPILVLEDLPPAEPQSFGVLGRIWAGGPHGLKAYAHADLESDALAQFTRILDGLRKASATALRLRDADAESTTPTRERFQRTARLEKALQHATAALQDLSQTATELVDHFGPEAGGGLVDLASILRAPAPELADESHQDRAPPPAPGADPARSPEH